MPDEAEGEDLLFLLEWLVVSWLVENIWTEVYWLCFSINSNGLKPKCNEIDGGSKCLFYIYFTFSKRF